MTMKIINVTVDSARPRELAEWWLKALNGSQGADYGEYLLIKSTEGIGMGFQFVADARPGSIHIDFGTADRAAETRRLLALGATHVADHEIPGADFGWTVLADPDGNHFCVSSDH